jgi:hypothetical protein
MLFNTDLLLTVCLGRRVLACHVLPDWRTCGRFCLVSGGLQQGLRRYTTGEEIWQAWQPRFILAPTVPDGPSPT